MMSGGELVVRGLREAGVETIFGLHGAHIDAVFQACLDAGLPIVDTRNEAAAGHAAEGYARARHTLGVALVTAGGGFTNVVTPLANAFLDRTPLLVITGSGPLGESETNTLQAGIDQVAIATPVTKWAYRVPRTELIPRLLAQAIRIATSAPRGPVLLDIPWDVLGASVAAEALAASGPSEPAAGAAIAADDAERALAILRGAERPVILVGSEAKQGGGAAALASLVETTGIPVFSDFEALGMQNALPSSHRGGLVQALHGWAGDAPDAVLMLGLRFGLLTAHGSGRLLPHDATIVQIDPDAREMGRLQPVTLGVAADAGRSLAALSGHAKAMDWPDRAPWRERVRGLIEDRRRRVEAGAGRSELLHPYEASRIVAEHVTPDTVVVADGALTYLWLSEVIAEAAPADFLCHGFLGSMGVGFGVALGVQAADRSRPTILVTGDGSVGYALGEFDTAVRHRLPLVVVVMNNRSWGATLHFQEMVAGANRVTNTRLENGAYDGVAQALGARGYHVSDGAGFAAALRDALASGAPACINVRVDLAPIPPEEMLLMGREPFGEPRP